MSDLGELEPFPLVLRRRTTSYRCVIGSLLLEPHGASHMHAWTLNAWTRMHGPCLFTLHLLVSQPVSCSTSTSCFEARALHAHCEMH